MTENDAMTLLAEANPVRLDALSPLGFPDVVRRPTTRLLLALAAAVLVAAGAALIANFGLGSRNSRVEVVPLNPRLGPCLGTRIGPRPRCGPSPQDPLGDQPIPLALAPAMLSAPVVLPDSSFINPSDVGVVEGASKYGQSAVGVGFPAQGLIVTYQRPAIPDPLANFQTALKSEPGSSVVYVNRVPALAQASSAWHSLEFVAGGTTIVAMGRLDLSTLEGVAQSIIEHSAAATLVPGGVKLPPVLPGEVPLSEASSALGASVALPARPVGNRAHLLNVLAPVDCTRPPIPSRPCTVWATVGPLTLIYERPAPWPNSRADYEQFAKEMPGGSVIELDGVPAVVSTVARSIYFTVSGTRVVVAGYLPPARLRTIARSIVDRSRSK